MAGGSIIVSDNDFAYSISPVGTDLDILREMPGDWAAWAGVRGLSELLLTANYMHIYCDWRNMASNPC